MWNSTWIAVGHVRWRRDLRILVATTLFATVAGCGEPGATSTAVAEDRLPVPAAESLEKSQELLKEVYGAEAAEATKPEAKSALASRLTEESNKSKSGSDAYAMLLAARTLAAQAADTEALQDVCQEMESRFVLDGLSEEVDAILTIDLELLKGPKGVAAAARMLALVATALGGDDFARARKLADAANQLATRTRNTELAKRSLEMLDMLSVIEPMFEHAKAARAALKTNPTDHDAHTKLGRFLCLVRGRWRDGLPHLAQGNEEPLKTLARRETSGALDAKAMEEIADAWWDYAAGQPPALQGQVKAHAASWYRRVLPTLDGLPKAKVEKRVAEGEAAHLPFDEPVDAVVDTGTSDPVRPGSGRQRPRGLKSPFGESEARAAQAHWAQYLGMETSITNSLDVELVLIPPGEFLMGTPASESGRTASEGPQHSVKLSKAMLVGRYEVTQAEYAQIMGHSPSYTSATGGGAASVAGRDTARFPAENMTWYDACEFCNRLSSQEELEPFFKLESPTISGGHIVKASVSFAGGPGYRLPTEAEHEYFTRAGTTTPFFFGSVHDGTQGNVMGTRPYGTSQPGPFLNRPTTVGSYAANAFGLHDVDGNVSEWCWDRFDPTYYSRFQTTAAHHPAGSERGDKRVMRGSSSQYEPVYARSGRRHGEDPAVATGWTGFRVVRWAE